EIGLLFFVKISKLNKGVRPNIKRVRQIQPKLFSFRLGFYPRDDFLPLRPPPNIFIPQIFKALSRGWLKVVEQGFKIVAIGYIPGLVTQKTLQVKLDCERR